PLFLKPQGGAAAVPVGSRVTVSVTGGPPEAPPPELLFDVALTDFQSLDSGSFQAELHLTHSGPLVARRQGHELAGWDLAASPDAPPTATSPEPPGPAAQESGHASRVRLPWQAEDDYGVVSLNAELRLRDRPGAPPLVIQLPLPSGSPKTAHGVVLQDL